MTKWLRYALPAVDEALVDYSTQFSHVTAALVHQNICMHSPGLPLPAHLLSEDPERNELSAMLTQSPRHVEQQLTVHANLEDSVSLHVWMHASSATQDAAAID